jgi:3-oxoacyl-[acyl-carrier protein] reductase
MTSARDAQTTSDGCVRVTAVVGASGGIGGAVAELFCEQGASVALIDVDAARLGELVERLADSGEASTAPLLLPIDVRLRDSCVAAVAEILGTFGRLDALVNSAGVTHFDEARELREDEWEDVLRVNLTGAFNMCAAAYDLLRQSAPAAVVNVGSVSGRTKSVFTSPAYVASKAGVIGLTMSLATRWARDEIRVNCVAPGMTETAMVHAYTAEQRAALEEAIPLGRYAHPREIASAIAFLASPAASYITGETLNVNGGLFMA